MEKKKNLLIALLLIWVAPSFAAKVDTLLIKSPSMNKEVQVVVVTPDAASGKKAVACPKGHDDRRRLAAPRHEHDIELKKKNGQNVGRSSFIPIPVPRYISSGNLPGISVSRIPCIVPCPESNNRE